MQPVAGSYPHRSDQRLEPFTRGGRLEIKDHFGLDAGSTDHGERVARGAAGGIVVDNHHGSGSGKAAAGSIGKGYD